MSSSTEYTCGWKGSRDVPKPPGVKAQARRDRPFSQPNGGYFPASCPSDEQTGSNLKVRFADQPAAIGRWVESNSRVRVLPAIRPRLLSLQNALKLVPHPVTPPSIEASQDAILHTGSCFVPFRRASSSIADTNNEPPAKTSPPRKLPVLLLIAPIKWNTVFTKPVRIARIPQLIIIRAIQIRAPILCSSRLLGISKMK